jgi:hypothetical protein
VKHRRASALLALVLLGGACTHASRTSSRATAPAGEPLAFVSMGGSETEGDGLADRFRAAWPYRFFHDTLPRETTFVNAAFDDATVAHTLVDQVPIIEELRPQLVAMFIGLDDLRDNTPIETFRRDLDTLLERIDDAGVRRVLVGDIPTGYGRNAEQYNRAIRTAAQTHGADSVALAGISVRQSTGDVPPELDTASHRLIADAFARAYQRAT